MNRAEKIKDYLGQAALGARNLHFFRITALPQLIRACSRIEKILLILATAALIVASSFLVRRGYYAATTEAPDTGGAYTEGLVGQPRYINPVLAAVNNVDSDISRIVYSGLLKFNSRNQLVPDLAAALPAVSADQKRYTITLRPGALWHDGSPVVADDIVFTIGLIQNPAYQSPLRLNWAKVEVKKTDDHTLTFTLKEPSAAFVTSLTQGILPKHIWEGIGAEKFALTKYNVQAIGSGPFTIKHVARSEEGEISSLTLVAWPRYYDGRPYLDRIEFKFYPTYDALIAAYHARAILGLGYVPFDKKAYVEKTSAINLYAINLPQYQALFFNRAKSPVLADRNVRYALAQSLNRQEIIREVYLDGAEASYGPIPRSYVGYNPGVEQAHLYNLDAAKKLLEQTGFKPVAGSPYLKKGELTLEFTIATNGFPVNIKIAELLKRQWEKIGFKVNLQILTISDLEQQYLRPRQYQALLFSENVGADPDPYAFWHSSQRFDPGLNLALFVNKEADQLILEARSKTDPSYRAPRYQRLQEILVQDVPAIFIANALYVYGVSSKVRGIELKSMVNQSERFLDIAHWYINTKRVSKK